VGESGCGKTVLCKSMLHLLCNRGTVKTGQALLDDVDLLTRNEKEMEQLRGKEVAMIFQDPMTSLNPSVSIGKQIEEVLFLHEKVTKLQGRKRVLELLDLVGIPLPEKRFYQMPYEFSGGMRQRVAIAIALAGNPKVLLADEPTTALDGETQTQILQLLKEIQKKTGVAIIFITHDLSLVETFADRVVVMLGGEIVEEGTVKALFENPHHEYTKRLMRYVNYGKGKEHTHGKHIHEEQSHDEKHRRQEQSHDENQLGREPFCGEKYRCQKAVQSTEAHNSGREKLLEVRNVSMDFKLDRHTTVKVLDELQLNICRGEIVGLIGPSGCGKSTLAKCMMNIYRPTGGEILYYGKNKQIIFQDSMSALNPRMTVEEIIAEPFRIQKS
ncbi:MAG: ATP-binding cassette domain-containing protein, partial [Anaerovorax sp.]